MSGVDPIGSRARRRAAWISLIVGFGMLAGKWVAYVVTGSHAILSDALESIVHVFATVFAVTSVALTDRTPDEKYPYGYGKIAYFSAGFEGALIIVAAVAIFYEAIAGLIAGTRPQSLGLGLGLIVAASAINVVLGGYLVREGRRYDSLILVADGRHVLTDAYTSFGVILGVALVLLTGWSWLDALVAMIVGANILRTGFVLVGEGYTGLMDRADPELLETIVDALRTGRHPGWDDVHQLRAWRSGSRTYVDFHLAVPETWTVGAVHDTIQACRSLIRDRLGPLAEVTIHFDPSTPGSGRFDPDHPWTVDHAVRTPGAASELELDSIRAS